MKHIQKLAWPGIMALIVCLALTLSSHASGFIFHWEPFVVDNNLFLSSDDKKKFVKTFSAFDSVIPVSDDDMNKFEIPSYPESSATQSPKNKSIAENIKIKFSLAYGHGNNKFPVHADDDDENISNVIDALTSLIYDPKFKSLETIGKIVEPQINFYFEF